MKEAKALIEKYKAGTCTAEEMRLIDKWLLEIHMGERSDLKPEDFEQIGHELWNRVLANRMNSEGSATSKTRTTKLWPRVAVAASRRKVWTSLIAAAAVAAITLGVWLYNISNTPRQSRLNVGNPEFANDIAPGKNTATLTLATGQLINLDTNTTSVVITDSVKTNLMLTASTPRGGQYQFILPDGTKVWLNADSKIRFPSQFVEKQRRILLEGEAYFEVAHNQSRPFIVESKGQEVTVLGTHFNINCYPDEGYTKTTLLEGRVNVNGTILKPNEQASLKGEALTVKQVDPAEAIDWKNGQFLFSKAPIPVIMRKISRWYDVDIVYEEDVSRETYTGAVSRYATVGEVLATLALTKGVQFKIEGRKITVSK